MRVRCDSPRAFAYHRYGGRGIKYDPRWSEFDAFLEDMEVGYSPGLELGRIDNDGDYCKDNCRWATRKEQCNNKSNNHVVETVEGRMTVAQIAERTGLNESTIRDRIRNGWPPEEILRPGSTRKRHSKLYETPEGQMTLSEMARFVGIDKKSMRHRINSGCTGPELLRPKDQGSAYRTHKKDRNEKGVFVRSGT